MHRIFVQIGPVTIYTYGVLVALAVIVSVFMMRNDCRKYSLPFDRILDCFVIALLGGIIGARALFVIINWPYYSEDVIRVLAFRDGGMAFHGGLILGAISGYVAMRVKKIDILTGLDLIAPYIALGHSIGRIGCFLNGCCYGKVVYGPLAVTFPGETEMRLPVQIYSSLALLALAVFLLWYRERKTCSGAVFSLYLVFYGLLRFFLEFLRGDNPAVFAGLTLGQIFSAGLFAAGVLMWALLSGRRGAGRK